MTALPSHHSHRVGIVATGRRQAIAGVLAGAMATLHDWIRVSEAKRKKKKCKKPNTCPQRVCCTCRDPMTFVVERCDYVSAVANFLTACTDFCQSHGLVNFQANGAVAGQANYCEHSLTCVRLDCPVS